MGRIFGFFHQSIRGKSWENGGFDGTILYKWRLFLTTCRKATMVDIWDITNGIIWDVMI
jgi:hypothetical protein